jgi:hypothetical protein
MFGAGASAWAHPHQNSKSEQAVVCGAGVKEPKDSSYWKQVCGRCQRTVFFATGGVFFLDKKVHRDVSAFAIIKPPIFFALHYFSHITTSSILRSL